MDGMKEYDYWQRLHMLRMRSQQRRMERYRIIYTWKILQEMVPNPGIIARISPRRGRLCVIPNLNSHASSAIKTMKDSSFMVHGPRLFNSLPQTIRF